VRTHELIRALLDVHSAFSLSLRETYGSAEFPRQQQRYLGALQTFHEIHPDAALVVAARAPGRVTIAGQHNDYNHGQIINFPIVQDTLVIASSRGDSMVELRNMDARYPEASFDSREGEIHPVTRALLHWTDYIRALHHTLQAVARQRGINLGGMNILVDGRPESGSVPIAAGLASSAALLVATGIVIAELADPPLKLSSSVLATAAMKSENLLGFPSGLQDPMGSLAGELGRPGGGRQAAVIDPIPRQAAGDPRVPVEAVPIPGGINLTLYHTGVPKGDDAWMEFNVRADEAKLGSCLLAGWLRDLCPGVVEDPGLLQREYADVSSPDRSTYPPFLRPFYFCDSELSRVGVSISPRQLGHLMRRLPRSADRNALKALGVPQRLFDELTAGSCQAGADVGKRLFDLRGSVRHVITEQARVRSAITAMRAGNLPRLGQIQNQILRSLDADYRVVSPAARELSRIAQAAPGVLGARSLGGVWSSVVAVWTAAEAHKKKIARIIGEEYYRPRGLDGLLDQGITTWPGVGAGCVCGRETGRNRS
jgi:galactokinase